MVGKRASTSLLGQGRVENNGPQQTDSNGTHDHTSCSRGRGGPWNNHTGMYVTARVDGIAINFLVDTGSSVTMLSTRMYNMINEKSTARLEPVEFPLAGVDGVDLEAIGTITKAITLGNIGRRQQIVVANISADGILGIDFLRQNRCQVCLVRHVLKMDGEEILCWSGNEKQNVCRVEIQYRTLVQPQTKTLVPIRITKSGQLMDTGLIEPRADLFMTKHIMAARCITDTKVPNQFMNIVNCGNETVELPPGFTMGYCESVDTIDDNPSVTDNVQQASELHCPRTDCVMQVTQQKQEVPEHVQTLLERSSRLLSDDESHELAELLSKYGEIFAKSKEDLGGTNLVKHTINTGNTPPIKQAPRRQPIEKRCIEHKEVTDMLNRGIIEPSSSPWSSPVVLVKKKSGEWRFCIDFRKVNACTIPDAYPIPRIDESLDSLSGAEWFCTMDLCSGYWQIEMDAKDKEKTAFATRMGLYQFRTMPFGLINAPATFERLMETVLRGLQWEECLVYIDDIIVFGTSVGNCLSRLTKVFDRLNHAGLKLRPDKCSFFQKEVLFLGHVVTPDGVKTDPAKVEAIRDWPIPVNIKQVRSFLGLCSYYRRFVKDFSKIASPLHKLTEKGVQFSWSEDCHRAFQTLKVVLTSTPILAYPCAEGQYILDTDASDKAMGAVLSQIQGDQERVIAFMSKSFTKAEQRYCVTRKEMCALVTALKQYKHYLYGRRIEVRTDNAAVSWMRNIKEPEGQMARWLERLGNFDLHISHRPGKRHTNADSLSRKPCTQCGRPDESSTDEVSDMLNEPPKQKSSCESIGMVTTRRQGKDAMEPFRPAQGWLDGWDPIQLRSAQESDPDIAPLVKALNEGQNRPKWQNISAGSVRLKTLWRQWDRLQVIGGVMYRKWYEENSENYHWQCIVPNSKHREVLWHFHDTPTAGHMGVARTLEKIRRNFYWTCLKGDVRKYCQQCDQCASKKPPQKKEKAKLRQYRVGERMERIAIDIVGPLPETDHGNRYIMVVADYFTKWTEAFGIPNQEAVTVADKLVREVLCRFGNARQIHSDQGRNFESRVFKAVCEFFDMDKTRTTGYHPESDGMVERYNHTLLSMLRMYAEDDQRKWDDSLPFVMMAYRASVHESTGKTPNEMMFGRNVTLPLDAVVASPAEEASESDMYDYDSYVDDLRERLRAAHDFARIKLRRSAQYQEYQYNLKANKRALSQGQPVWLHDPSRTRGVCPKLKAKWTGPFVITQKIDDLVYRVQKHPRANPKVVHLNRLKPYEGVNPPQWYKSRP